MITPMGHRFVETIKSCYDANLPVLVTGRHGIGKSEALIRVAKELKIKCIVRDLSLMEPTDLLGLPVCQSNRTCYAPPAFLPTSGKGLLVFEELNRAPSYMRAPTLQLLTARALNDYRLPPGWLPVAAINPSDNDYDVTELDPALMSRFVRVSVEPDRDEWLTWANENNVHRAVISYVGDDDSIFDHADSNPRSWTYVSNYLNTNLDKVSQGVLQGVIFGLIGEERGGAFITYLNSAVSPMEAEDIFGRYDKHRRKMKSWIRKGKLDLVNATLLKVLTELQARNRFDEVNSSRQKKKNLATFIGDLPGDLRESAEAFFAEAGYPKPKLSR